MLGTILSGRYKVIDRLGRGGFSETYLAEDTQLPDHSICVIKQFKPKFDDPEILIIAQRLFENEAKVLNKLGIHDQIPRLLASFSENDEFFLVQELIEGHSLDYELIPGIKWTEVQVIAFIQDILKTLEFVHQQKVIHRDIKPENIIRRKKDAKLVLIDFGAVKQVYSQMNSSGSTRHTITVGTSGYMPSEQANGRPHPASDIYAVGMIAIQALTGLDTDCIPQNLDTLEIDWQDLRDLDLINASPELINIVSKMVKYDFRQRYASVAEILEDLAKFADEPNQPTLITPVPVARQIGNATTFAIKGLQPLSKLNSQDQKQSNRSFTTITVLGLGLSAIAGFVINSFNQVQNSTNSLLPNKSEAIAPQINTNPQNKLTASELVTQGLKLESTNFKDAITSFDQALKLKPDYADAYAARANALFTQGKYQQALDDYNQALRFKSSDPKLWNAKGNTLAKLTWYAPAVNAYNQAIKLKPDYAEAIGGKAIATSKISPIIAKVQPPKTPPKKVVAKIISSPEPTTPSQPEPSQINSQSIATNLPENTPVITSQVETRVSPRPGDRPNLAVAAEKLGITEIELKNALGGRGRPPDLEQAAIQLKINEDRLRSILTEAGGFVPPKRSEPRPNP